MRVFQFLKKERAGLGLVTREFFPRAFLGSEIYPLLKNRDIQKL